MPLALRRSVCGPSLLDYETHMRDFMTAPFPFLPELWADLKMGQIKDEQHSLMLDIKLNGSDPVLILEQFRTERKEKHDKISIMHSDSGVVGDPVNAGPAPAGHQSCGHHAPADNKPDKPVIIRHRHSGEGDVAESSQNRGHQDVEPARSELDCGPVSGETSR